jgi:hypothetical protein
MKRFTNALVPCDFGRDTTDVKQDEDDVRPGQLRHRKDAEETVRRRAFAVLRDAREHGLVSDAYVTRYVECCLASVAGAQEPETPKTYAESEAECTMWLEFIQAWWAEFGAQTRRVCQLNDFCKSQGYMVPVCGGGTERSQQVRLGKALLGVQGGVFDGLRLTAVKTNHRSRLYSLEYVTQDPDAAGTEGREATTEVAP